MFDQDFDINWFNRMEWSREGIKNVNDPDVINHVALRCTHQDRWICDGLLLKPELRAESIRHLYSLPQVERMLARQVVKHPNTPSDVLEDLCTGSWAPILCAQLRTDPRISEETRQQMQTLFARNNHLGTLQEEFKQHEQLVEFFTEYNIKPLTTLYQMNISLERIAHVRTPAGLCKTLFGTAHPLEVSTLMSTVVDKSFIGFKALVILRRVFHNPIKNKLNRHDYLAFLRLIKRVSCPSLFGFVDAEYINYALENLGMPVILKIICGNSPDEAADTLRL